jgi:5S rRNA maturation endonuclease (ribonuclease M5)
MHDTPRRNMPSVATSGGDMTAPVDRLLERLDKVKQSGAGWTARCPGHDDKNPSLSISEGDKVPVVLKCHAGCELDEILAAVNLKASDLFDKKRPSPSPHRQRTPDVVYPYADEQGTVLFGVKRTASKDFYQLHPNGNGGWAKGRDNARLVLYRLPQVRAAVADGRRIFIVEGEKDADALDAAGEVATTSPMGAKNWNHKDARPSYAASLAGARDVIVVADKDENGHAYAREIVLSLHGKTEHAPMLVEAREGKDASDHLAAGYTPDEFAPFTEAPTIAPANTPDSAPDATAGELPETFWTARPALAHIRRAAHSRQRSAPAVLHAVLARIAAMTPHTVELPPIVGTTAPLCYFAVLIAPPGVGKSSANRVADELVPNTLDDQLADQLPIGSGEGLVEILFGYVIEEEEDGTKKRVKRQIRYNAFAYVDEGLVLTDIGQRAGSTLLPTLRTIWTGGTIGNTNASEERKRIVLAGLYSYGVIVALQETAAGALLDDAPAGTPQRFAWAHATDPTIPDTPPTWPGPLDWTPPDPGELARIETRGAYIRHRLTIASEIATEIRGRDRGRARGQTRTDPLDAHEDLLRLKIAALLALLDQRLDVNAADWQLAGTLKDASDTVRARVVTTTTDEANRRESATAARHAGRAVAADSAIEKNRILAAARKIARKIHDEPDRWIRREMQQAMRNYREVFDDALDHAIGEHWITEHAESGQGEDRRALRPGTETPT